MLGFTLKKILNLVPDALEHVKQASIEQSLPLDSRDSCIASALEVKYHEVVDGKSVDPYDIEKVASAVKVYGVSDVVKDLNSKLIKAAELSSRESYMQSRLKETYFSKEAMFKGELTGFINDPLSKADKAEALVKQASELGVEPCEEVVRYSSQLLLDKSAALNALSARYQATKDAVFVKIATAIGQMPESGYKPETVKDICRTISGLDKMAGLNLKGFDFYKEALLTKEALVSVLRIRLGSEEVPYESIERVGRSRIAQYVGEDVAKEMDAGPENTKAVLETLPRDLQRVVLDLIKNC